MYRISSLAFALIFLLSACGSETKEISKIENPKLVAVAFFEAIYKENNINKAAAACSPKLSRLLLHYKTSKSVARHMFNMSFEEIIDIRPDDTGVKVRERFKDKAVVTVYLEGYYQGGKLKDVKRLSLIQKDNEWLIDEILKDPF
ncbi:hypothetical protein NBRC116592_26060 [Colwellia sp. KU-HH00111]|uniref:hypothetical protein n=1 Tax=Colwellia sp. KU-HH00111 TaxID=3127652 RepID=UPI0031083D0D